MPKVEVVSSQAGNFSLEIPEMDGDPNQLGRKERDFILLQTYEALDSRPTGTIQFSVEGKRYRFEEMLRGSSSDRRAVASSPEDYQKNLMRALLPNLLAHGRHTSPYRWDENGVAVVSSSSAPKVDVDQGFARIAISTKLRLPKGSSLLEVTPYFVDVLKEYTREYKILKTEVQDNEVLIEGRAGLPLYCSTTTERRSEFRVLVKWQDPDGVHEAQVPIELDCFLGDIVDERDVPYVELATSATNLPSPECDQLAREIRVKLAAEKQPLTLENASRQLASLLKARGSLYLSDPTYLFSQNFTRAQSYFFRPAETLRFHGDCEDWAILGAAVLLRLGFEALPAQVSMTHVVTLAREAKPGAPVHFMDLTEELPESR